MARVMSEILWDALGELRFAPLAVRLRATLGGETVVDSGRAMLVWEPRRVVPTYAVPAEDVHARLVPSGEPAPDAPLPPVLDPGHPFTVRAGSGRALDVRTAHGVLTAAAFRPDDPALAGHVVLDFAAFDAWYEEDVPVVGHPRDPYHRVDVLPSSRPVGVSRDGMPLAASSRAVVVVETGLAPRRYLPREDVTADLVPSTRRTLCAYKGEARYWSVDLPGVGPRDIAWSYPDPLPGMERLAGLVAFYDEVVDVEIDGVPRPRPTGPLAALFVAHLGL